MNEHQHRKLSEIVSLYRDGAISRRRALQMLTAAGLAAVAAPAIFSAARAQDSATPSPVAPTPVVGPQEGGTNLWKVQVGTMDMANGIDVHAFFPGEITINEGDSIWYEFMPMGVPGFHTVLFLSGAAEPPFFIPDVVNGTPVPSPQGPPRLILNPMLAFPDGRTEYDGTGTVSSGVDVLRTPDTPPYMLKFTKAGSYDYQCAFHGLVMKAKVNVQAAGSALPHTVDDYEQMSKDEQAKVIAEGQTAAKAAEDAAAAATPVTSGAQTWDVMAGAGGQSQARVMRFIPHDLTIKAGDTVRWTDGTAGEPHTVTFLGGAAQPEDTIVEPQANGMPKLIQSYDTFLPAGGNSFDGTGYHNSGFLGLPPEIGDMFHLNGNTYELTFTKAGDYPYYCILHSGGPDDAQGMTGKITVQ